MQTSVLDVTVGFEGDVLGPVRFEDAVTRVLAFCTAPHSGWLTYDLAGHHARTSGASETVTPWSLLWADALAGQVSVRNVADFTQERRRRFASLLAEVPDEDLHRLDDDERERVAALCRFGFPGAWGPKITKVAALYRPRAVPVLDGYVAMAFGFARDGFTEGVQPRHERIRQVLAALASWLGDSSTGNLTSGTCDLQDTLGGRGHKDDPLYKIRGLLRIGAEHLSDRHVHPINAPLPPETPFKVTVAWHVTSQNS